MTITDNLIALKAQYEGALERADTNADQYQAQLNHINALLLDQLLQNKNGFVPTTIWDSPASFTAITPGQDAITAQSKSKLITTKAPNSRVSLPFLPTFKGMKKLDAIAQVLEDASDEVLHHDEIIQALYGTLSLEDLKAERLRMKTAMYQGVKQNLWQKAPSPSSYTLKSFKGKSPTSQRLTPTAKAKSIGKGSTPKTPPKTPAPTPAPTPNRITKGRKNVGGQSLANTPKMIGAKPILPMHKDFAGLSKIDAVLKVMEENSGKTVHIDAIIERLYGSLSIAEAKAEKGRMKDVMSRGRERSLWQKARAPLSFIVGKAEIASVKATNAPNVKAKRSNQQKGRSIKK
jgi:hypothetical protein